MENLYNVPSCEQSERDVQKIRPNRREGKTILGRDGRNKAGTG